jgi:hypothetical protein
MAFNYLKVKKSQQLICSNFTKTIFMSLKYLLKFHLIISISIILFFLIGCSSKIQVSLIVHHGKIYTVDSNFSIVEAMAIKDGKIIATGNNDEIMKKYTSDSLLNANGQAIFPGFIDAHCHFTGFATDRWKCDLMGTASFDEIVEKIKNYSKTAPIEWIYGHGWDQNDWEIKEFPQKKYWTVCSPIALFFLKELMVMQHWLIKKQLIWQA